MKKVLYLIIIFFFFLVPTTVFAADYRITKYDIDITVNENNTLDVKESITANFNIAKHGIYRFIPLKNYVGREDGTENIVRAKVKRIKVNKEFETYTENNQKVIQIGSSNYTVLGPQTYEISYTYDLGRDKNKGFDELYYNIIGTGWDTTLSNVTFTIHMPKNFDKNKFGISTGKYGNSGSNDVVIEIEEKDIKGSITKTLEPNEAVTTRIELEDGYFIRPLFEKIDYLLIMVPLLLAGLGLFLWRKYGVDDEIIETVEFYPPDGYNSAEIGYIYKNSADNKDVVSLLIYLADKGYIKIEETEKSKKFTLTKIKDYDGDNEIEKQFLEGLFKEKNTVKESDLSEKFYTTVTTIKFKLAKLRSKIYLKKSDNKRPMIAFLMITTLVLPIIYFAYSEEILYIVITVVMSLLIILATAILASTITQKKNNMGIYIIGTLLFVIIVGFLYLAKQEYLEWNYSCIFIATIASVYLLCLSFAFIPKRTAYGTEIIGKIKGFRNFLKNAEKTKLEELVMENPNYFYNILPYTYVLGVSDKWIKKFESIAMTPPDWYASNTSTFDMIYFSRAINRTMRNATTVMTSIPAPKSGGGWSGSSGGFSSGGGFSGGGSGGGGGGSW